LSALEFETLESRLVLDAAPVISEFWADFELDADGEDVQLVNLIGQVVSENAADPSQPTNCLLGRRSSSGRRGPAGFMEASPAAA